MSESKVSTGKLLDGHSPVNKYDLLALEQLGEGLTEKQVFLAFQAFDELVPSLGVFTRIFQKLRGHLFDAVYSDELTGATDIHGRGDNQYIQRLPYFALVRQVHSERHEIAETLKIELDIVQKRLIEKQNQLEVEQETISHKDDHIKSLLSQIEGLESVIKNRDQQIAELKEELERTKETSKNKEHNLTCDIRELTESLEDAKNEVNNLLQFKQGYDDLYFAFMDKKDILDGESHKKKLSFISTKRFEENSRHYFDCEHCTIIFDINELSSNLLSGVESGQKLEKQITSVMNTCIEEYDKFIEDHKFTQLETVAGDHLVTLNHNLEEMDLIDELENVQTNFQNSASSLLAELRLLQQHNTMLVDQLQKLEEKRKPDKGSMKPGTVCTNSGNFSLYEHLVEMQAEELDPFIPHEGVFSKYAAMLFTSNNNGKTFEELGDATFCVSCGEKTLICPHKIHGPEKVFSLPPNCSHVKLTRPKVRINKQFVNDQKLKVHRVQPTLEVATSQSNSFITCMPDQAHSKSSSMPVKQITSMEDGSSHMPQNMQRLWGSYKQKTKMERVIPRTLDLERTRSLVEQFLGYLIWTDEFMSDSEANLSILETFYNFMQSRYLLEDVMLLATHDFLSAIMKFCEVDKMVQLFGLALSGSLDASCLRYILLMFEFISAVAWKEVQDFRPFSSVVYPFLNEDDLESLQMSYTSFSQNKISSHLVASFIINTIERHKEPRFQNLAKKLAEYEGAETGRLTDSEFKEALESVLPLCSELTRRRLYMQAERAVECDGFVDAVPIRRLAPSMLKLGVDLCQMFSENSATLLRGSRTSNEATTAKVPETADQKKLPTMGYVKQFAANLNRQVKQREERKSLDVVW